MSVSDGQRVNAQVTNAAFVSRTTDSDTVGKIDLNNADTAPVVDVQATINDHQAQITSNDGDISTLFSTKQNLAEKDQPNGYAGLDGDGKISSAALPFEAVEYKGNWDASTNTPTLVDGTGDIGDVYRASVAGTQDLGSGSQDFAVGDWVTYNGTIWQKSDFATAGVLNDLTDVNTAGAADGQALVFNAGTWAPGNVQSIIQENITIVAKGTGAWDATTGDFVLSDDIFLSVPPLPNSYHTIQAQTISIADGECAYISIDRDAAMTTNLTVTVAAITAVTPDNNIMILLRRVGSDVYFGLHDPTRIEDGETVTLQKGGSGAAAIANVIDTKFLPANRTTNGVMPELTFSGLVIGDTYEVRGAFRMFLDIGGVADDAIRIDIKNGTTDVHQVIYQIGDSNLAVDQQMVGATFTFVATDTTLTFETVDASANSFVGGTGNRTSTYVQLEKRNDLEGATVPDDEKNKVQTKVATTDTTSSVVISDLTFNNLVVGRFYEISGQIHMAINSTGASKSVGVLIENGAQTIGFPFYRITDVADGGEDNSIVSLCYKFQATATSLTFTASGATASAYIRANGNKDNTYAQIEERNDLIETVEF